MKCSRQYGALLMLVGLGCLLLPLNNNYIAPIGLLRGKCTTEFYQQVLPSSSSQSQSQSTTPPTAPSLFLWPTFDIRGEQNDAVEEADECEWVTRRIRQLNDCAISPDCRHAHSFQQLPQPMLNIAYYKDQGFGRLIEHSVKTCLIAASVGRPCLVDITKRDEYYTFRSFIESRLDVDVNALAEEYRRFNASSENNNYYLHFGNKPILEEDTVTEIRQAFARLAQPQVGHWTSQDLKGIDFQHVLPLGDDSYTDHPDEAMLQNPHKLAISPNWGTSWFGRKGINWPASKGSCHGGKLQTYMQNYMYRPTALLRQLHQHHKELVLGTTWDSTNRPFGAIHLRFVIMRSSKVFPNDNEGPQVIDNALQDMARKLLHCLQVVKQDDATAVDKWWLLTDKLTYGQNLTRYLNEMSTNSSSQYHPQVFLETDPADKTQTSSIIQKIASHRLNGEIAHSLNKNAVGLLGHEFMASSMLDWMALYESKVSLITEGAFAGTGAKGNGKYKQDTSNDELEACRLFQIFHV
jgi:hypothetical protein